MSTEIENHWDNPATCPAGENEKDRDTGISQSVRIKSSRSATREGESIARKDVEGGCDLARMHARACRSRICPSSPRDRTRRIYAPTICYNRGLARAHLYLSTLALGASAPTSSSRLHPRPDASARPVPIAGSTGRASVNTRTSAELWGAGTPTSWSSKARKTPTHTDAFHPGAG